MVTEGELDLNLCVLGEEALERWDDDVPSDDRRRFDTQQACGPLAEASGVRLRGVEIPESSPRAFEEDTSLLREAHGARRPMKEANAYGVLELGNTPARRGRREMQPFGRCREAAELGDLHEGFDASEPVHRQLR
jgi:hypothetical protein